MRNYLTISDTHGVNVLLRAQVEEYLSKSTNNYFVFNGDCWDTKDKGVEHGFESQKSLFLFLVELKNKYKDQVFLLYGNHDAQYNLRLYKESYCGTPQIGVEESVYLQMVSEINSLYQQYEHLFQWCHQYKNYFFVHAGLSNSMLELLIEEDLSNGGHSTDKQSIESYKRILIEENKLDGFINSNTNPVLYKGVNLLDGIIWIRPFTLKQDLVPGLTQIVGHTRCERLIGYPGIIHDTKNSIYFVDCKQPLLLSI